MSEKSGAFRVLLFEVGLCFDWQHAGTFGRAWVVRRPVRDHVVDGVDKCEATGNKLYLNVLDHDC